MDFRPVFLVNGILLATLALFMCVPAFVDWYTDHDNWTVFAASAGLTLFVGVAMAFACNTGGARLNIRQAFLMTTLAWVLLAIFASIPFRFSSLGLSFTDAFFEAMSGLTTTGSTVITGLDFAPPGILLWRSLLQWFGGIGIIVMAIAILPLLRVGGMQLFRMESSEQGDKALPRAAEIAMVIGVIYLLLTIVWSAAYWFAGMSGFDAITHAMTTIATGGFSTHDDSLGYFDNPYIDIIATVGMIMGALPFLLYLKTIQGDWRALFNDSQVQWFLIAVGAAILVATAWLWLDDGRAISSAVRHAAFNVVSIITGTGYATEDYTLWGAFATPLFFFIMFIGGCAGSTTCGIKVFRFQVLYAAASTQMHHLMQPSGIFIPHYNRRPISDEVIVSVLSFFFVFGVCYALLALGLGMLGLDFLSAISSAATAISNVGPALGPIVGPAGNFSSLPDGAKWLLAWGMLLGRLELFTVLVLFTRAFWRG
ncbi:MAG: TrkH family potassium uptake protein [Rhodospirillales bacterium]|nr:TrkH family potassium uptake protein [Rhodospirillales bacterium]MBT4039154.1 TrkH family potassium uptake protein [Rhodospirillales bacterium]MBT4627543.1 TrkH family potassium uptake protein [Rhodospirillales bacterium]MBT5520181.1 TrkH family potassium uptake protein [Rhodospirillales bacterium]MBT6108570.1 TrkH family potassium uptake protein [Rhodospirillales bacterium]